MVANLNLRRNKRNATSALHVFNYVTTSVSEQHSRGRYGGALGANSQKLSRDYLLKHLECPGSAPVEPEVLAEEKVNFTVFYLCLCLCIHILKTLATENA